MGKVEDVRIVPGGVEDITVGWCDKARAPYKVREDFTVTKKALPSRAKSSRTLV